MDNPWRKMAAETFTRMRQELLKKHGSYNPSKNFTPHPLLSKKKEKFVPHPHLSKKKEVPTVIAKDDDKKLEEKVEIDPIKEEILPEETILVERKGRVGI